MNAVKVAPRRDYDLPKAQRAIMVTMRRGAVTHPGDPWRRQSKLYHLWRVATHLTWWELGRTNEPHLAHALTRLAMILELEK